MDTMHFLPSIAIQPNLELKTWPKQLIGYLPLVIALPALADEKQFYTTDVSGRWSFVLTVTRRPLS